MIKYGDPNPLNILGMRRMEYCAPHFEKVFFDSKVHDKILINWIYENLEGRFYFNDELVELTHGMVTAQKCAAFEIHSEASFFCFALDKLNKSSYLF